ncbi:MAG: YCF48-related protein [candidate division WOR-3 bacterium]
MQKRDTIYDFFDVKFKDSLEGWVVGGNDSTMEGCVYHTTDGGQTWNRQTLPQSAKILNSLELIGENKLWAVGRNGTIIHSSDGGISWQMQNSGIDTTFFIRC